MRGQHDIVRLNIRRAVSVLGAFRGERKFITRKVALPFWGPGRSPDTQSYSDAFERAIQSVINMYVIAYLWSTLGTNEVLHGCQYCILFFHRLFPRLVSRL